METLAGIIFIIVIYCIYKMPEWKSNNYTPLPGMKIDYGQASVDLTLHGKDYYRKKATGGYNIPNPYYNKKNK